ncbi:hypothetical protein FAES_3926 [Fibrella aestuarina BUZ 2]|uniref:Uncharacterized protein n=1 Tax=Fibrella aestuarina BUZ 2 TaxID=1166018 RepID=I0KCS9_9BACT|nr:hypothetical protein [Fibrella aestuarina]CCH01932.1 hypothetical protein FAES_3926 [Fibrella aestuarina BUZ 2]
MDLSLEKRTYELLRDIALPNKYMRAGTRKTGAEWIALGYAQSGTRQVLCPRWFRDLTTAPTVIQDPLKAFCRDVLAEHGLYSLTFIDAAAECVRRAQTIPPPPPVRAAVPVCEMTCSTRLFNILCGRFSRDKRGFTLVDCLANGLTKTQFMRCNNAGKATLTELENLLKTNDLELPL